MARKPDYFSSGEKLTSSRLNDILRYMFSITPKGDGKTVKVTQTPSGTTISAGHKSSTAMSKKTESILIKVKANIKQTLTDQYFCDVYENGAEEEPTILNQKAFAVPSFILTEDTFFFSNSKIDDVYYFESPLLIPSSTWVYLKSNITSSQYTSEWGCDVYINGRNSPATETSQRFVGIFSTTEIDMYKQIISDVNAGKTAYANYLWFYASYNKDSGKYEFKTDFTPYYMRAVLIKIKSDTHCDIYANGKDRSITTSLVPYIDVSNYNWVSKSKLKADTWHIGFPNYFDNMVYIQTPRWL